MPYSVNDGHIHSNTALCCPHCGYPKHFHPPFKDGERRECICWLCDEPFIFRAEETAQDGVWHYWLEEK